MLLLNVTLEGAEMNECFAATHHFAAIVLNLVSMLSLHVVVSIELGGEGLCANLTIDLLEPLVSLLVSL